MSTSVLPKLLEVDSKLSAQETSLAAQLVALQEKRKGIQTVIDMFDAEAESDAASAPSKATESKADKKKTSESKASKRRTPKSTKAKSTAEKSTAAKSTATKSTAAKSTAAKSTANAKTAKGKVDNKVDKATTKTKTSKVKATRGRPPKAKASSASETKKTNAKRSGRTANWQKYIQDSYSKAALPDVIVGVLQAQPDSIFKIADVMNVVFKEDMPKTHFLKARNRVSNILSAGARDGEWYRGRGGTYSVSEKAIKAVG